MTGMQEAGNKVRNLLPVRQLGRTDMKITRVGLGTWAIGGTRGGFGWGPQDDGESIAALRHAVERGINWIDTAPAYGAGHAEEIIGRALADMPAGERPYVFTKCGLVWNGQNPTPSRCGAPQSIRREVEASLERLGIERLDLCLMHWPAEDVPLETCWETLMALKQEGKIRAIGLSNHSVDLLERAERLGHVETVQLPFSAIRRDLADNELPWCRVHNTGVIVYSPMQAGLLSGTFTLERARGLAKDDWRSGHPNFAGEKLLANLKLAGGLKVIAERRRTTTAVVAVAWTLSWLGVTGAIVGARRPLQIDGWLDASELALSSREMTEIGELIGQTAAGTGPTL